MKNTEEVPHKRKSFHINILRKIPQIGEKKYKKKLKLFILKILSLENNLIASLKGWIKPIKPTLLGPNRSWEYPKILRSTKVKKATEIKIKTKTNKDVKNQIIKGETLLRSLNSLH